MEWSEIKARLKLGTSVQILADLNGVPYKTMYNRIKQHELKDGVVYMKPDQLNQRKKKQPEVIEPKPEEVRPDFVLHPSPESVEAIDKMEEKLQEAREKLTSACQKMSEKLREAIPTPEVKIQVVEDAEKGPEEEGGSPEVLSSVADRIIDELDERIDHLNDELQKLEDKKLELLYEAGIWKNILAALKRERGEA